MRHVREPSEAIGHQHRWASPRRHRCPLAAL